MKWREQAVLQTSREVQGFLDAFAGELGPISRSPARRDLDAAVAALAAAGAMQALAKGTSESLTVVKNERRKDLLDDHVRLIVAIAQKRTASGTLTPGIQGFKVPKRRTPDNILAQSAKGMAKGAKAYTGVFVAQTMPRTFAREARRAAAALQATLRDRTSNVLKRTAATAEAAHQASVIRDAIRVLHGLVDSRLHRLGLQNLRDAWRETKRYPQKPGPKRRRKEQS